MIEKEIRKSKNIPSKIISSYFFMILIIVFYSLLILRGKYDNIDILPLLSFFTISLFSLVVLIKEVHNRPYSIVMIHWVFILIFFGLAGFLQYLNSSILYFNNLSGNKIFYVNTLILVWMLFFYFGTKTNRSKISKNKVSKYLRTELLFNYKSIVFFTIISISITSYFVYNFGVNSLLSRTANNASSEETSLALYSLIQVSLRNFVLYGLAITIVYYLKHKKGFMLVLMQIFSMLITNSPFSLGRFYIATAYMGLLILYFPIFKKGKVFIYTFFTGFVIIFPMINVFRNTLLTDVSFNMLLKTIDNISSNYLYGDYDAYSMIIYTIRYINDFGITFGFQLLGAFTFFVPRILWPNKPIGSGALILETYGHSFTNGSASLIAEGLMNFGFIGLIIFGFAFGRVFKYLDNVYWFQSFNNKTRFIDIFYPFMIFLLFFMSRGDLMNTFAFFASHFVIFILVFHLNNLMMRFRLNSS